MIIEFAAIIIFIAGLICLVIPSEYRRSISFIAMLGSIISLIYSINNFIIPFTSSYTGLFQYNTFAGLIALCTSFFAFITVCFSLKYSNTILRINKYYAYILFVVCYSILTVFSTNLIVFTVFWGLSGLMLYLLANLSPQASGAAKKSFIFIGGSDALIVLGISILYYFTGSFDFYNVRLSLSDSPVLVTVSFLCLLIAALTKAGAVPFHTWVPDFAENVPLSITAFLPAAVDKLLGIFLLVVICKQIFLVGTAVSLILLLTGAITIIFAVYMSIIQNDIKKMLAFSGISQVGYIILGIAAGTPLGIAASIFHMINHAIYKSALFLTAGAVEYRNGTTQMEKLGGLSKYMPLTFTVCLIASLSVSGIPPFNGFASKWMIYQSLIQQFENTDLSIYLRIIYILCLVTAMFGSAFTLSNFIKYIHSVFMGQAKKNLAELKNNGDVEFTMAFPMIILMVLCVLFGIFPYTIPIKYFVLPAISTFNIYFSNMPGLWQADIAAYFIFSGLILGVILYVFGNLRTRNDKIFTGGEETSFEARADGSDFYKTISDIKLLKAIYLSAEKKFFDIYYIGAKFVKITADLFSMMHTGNLHTYLLFFFLGFAFLFLVMLR